MKQYITRNQWDEINEEQKKLLIAFCYKTSFVKKGEETAYTEIPIGYLISFLGNESTFEINGKYPYAWSVGIGSPLENENKRFNSMELCDALWEAVKDKLNKWQKAN